jgi:hypothetical protein
MPQESSLSPKAISLLEDCSPRHITQEIRRGNMRAYKIGKRGYRVTPADYAAWRALHAVVITDVVGAALNELASR